jgi:hypothetical protein
MIGSRDLMHEEINRRPPLRSRSAADRPTTGGDINWKNPRLPNRSKRMINDRENRLCCRPKFGVPEHPAAWLISLDRTVEQIDRGSG